MSWSISEITEPTARKDYHCEASDWIDNELGWDKRYYNNDEDYQIVKKARKENCKILKGTKYIQVKGKWDGEFMTFRARKDLNYICHKYDIYCE